MEAQEHQPNSDNYNTADRQAPLSSATIRLRIIVQPEDVQVKRVGRASCIEPDIKVCIESDAPHPSAITINAYLKVLGKDNKHKLILLRKSDEMMFTKAHGREIVNMKLRFLKTIKVQVLKRNLGVTRPEASIVLEAVNRHNEVLATTSTTQFAIISDPRYLDEVKKRRAQERVDDGYQTPDSSDESYEPPAKRGPKRRRSLRTGFFEGDADFHQVPVLANGNLDASAQERKYSLPCSSTASPTPLPALQALKDSSDFELSFADSDEEEYKLIKLVESLKHKGCNFRILPPETHT
jgi:hypothetical protein